MEFKKFIFVLAITATIIVCGVLGSSYAYYTATETNIDVTTGNVNNNISVVFQDNNYVNVKTGVPIDDANVNSLVTPTTFSIYPNSAVLSDYDVFVNISLINVKIDENLRVEDFKYKLQCFDSNDNSSLVVEGNGVDFVSENLALGGLSTDSSLNINNDYTCNFRVWISNKADVSQNELMDKRFSALVKVNTVMRKK